MKILVTGAAGFIGMTASLKLLARGDEVVGLDNLNDYYDVNLKHNRLKRLTSHANFRFVPSPHARAVLFCSLFPTDTLVCVVVCLISRWQYV